MGRDLDNPILALEKFIDSLCELGLLCRFDTLRKLIEGASCAPVSLIHAFWRSCLKYPQHHKFAVGSAINEQNLADMRWLITSRQITLEDKAIVMMYLQKSFQISDDALSVDVLAQDRFLLGFYRFGLYRALVHIAASGDVYNNYTIAHDHISHCSFVLLHNMIAALGSCLSSQHFSKISPLVTTMSSHMALTWTSLQRHYPCDFDTNVSLAALEAWFSERNHELGRWHQVLNSCSSWIVSDLDPVAPVYFSWRHIDNISRRVKGILAFGMATSTGSHSMTVSGVKVS